MSCDKIMERMTFLLWGEELNRVSVKDSADGSITITVDVHRLTRKQANKLLSNIIKLFMFPFTLDVIHGFNRGTAIKTMLNTDFSHDRVLGMHSPVYNPGETFIQVA